MRPLTWRIEPALGPLHRTAEEQLLAGGARLPLPHRIAWLEELGNPDDLFAGLFDERGRCVHGLVVEVTPLRSLPLHHQLRIQRWTPPETAAAASQVAAALRQVVRGRRLALRLSVEVFAIDEQRVEIAEQALRTAGFTQVVDPRRYDRTLVVPLDKDEAALLAGLHHSARRKIRAVAMRGLSVRSVDDPALAPRLQELLSESFQGTGAEAPVIDFERRMTQARRRPDLIRMVGLFRDGPERQELLAFCSAHAHGDSAHYDASGATRSTGEKVSTAYALIWDLIMWSKSIGCAFFDLGGVTAGSFGDGADALGGISDFKRYFSRQEARVGGEWVLEPHPLRARLSRAIYAQAGRAKALFRRYRPLRRLLAPGEGGVARHVAAAPERIHPWAGIGGVDTLAVAAAAEM